MACIIPWPLGMAWVWRTHKTTHGGRVGIYIYIKNFMIYFLIWPSMRLPSCNFESNTQLGERLLSINLLISTLWSYSVRQIGIACVLLYLMHMIWCISARFIGWLANCACCTSLKMRHWWLTASRPWLRWPAVSQVTVLIGTVNHHHPVYKLISTSLWLIPVWSPAAFTGKKLGPVPQWFLSMFKTRNPGTVNSLHDHCLCVQLSLP